MSRSPKKLNHEKTRRQGLNGTLMYTLSSGKISAVWYSGTLNSKNKRLFSIRHCTIRGSTGRVCHFFSIRHCTIYGLKRIYYLVLFQACLIICYVNLSSHVHVFTRKLILVQIVISYHCLFPNWIQSYCQLNYGIDIRESDLWSDHSKHHTKLACVNYLSNYELYLKRRHCHNLVLIYGTRMCFAKF